MFNTQTPYSFSVTSEIYFAKNAHHLTAQSLKRPSSALWRTNPQNCRTSDLSIKPNVLNVMAVLAVLTQAPNQRKRPTAQTNLGVKPVVLKVE